MVNRKKVLFLLSLSLICIIGTITAIILYNGVNESKNVFEEMYYAEMNAAKLHQNTPLSNTEYFDEAPADYVKYKGGKLSTLSVKELPKDSSSYTLVAEDMVYRGDNSPFWSEVFKQKILKIDSNFLYRDIIINMQYWYILCNQDNFQGTFYESLKDRGLYVSITAVVNGRRETSLEEFSTYGIKENELSYQITQDLETILKYWVDNYPASKFNTDYFGEYEIVGPNRDLFV